VSDRTWNWQVARFSLSDQEIGSLKDLRVEWRGHGEITPGYETKIALWDVEAGSWKTIESVTGCGADTDLMGRENGTPNSFCVSCHDGAPPSGVIFPSNVKPITWNMVGSGDVHGTRSASYPALKPPYYRGYEALDCSVCHEAHGNGNLYHLAPEVNGNSVVATTGNEVKSLCYSCHQGNVKSWHQTCRSCHDPYPEGDGGGCGYGYIDSPETTTFHYYPNEDSNCLLCHNHGSSTYVNSDNRIGVQDSQASSCGGCHGFAVTF
jgi:hypothetical protein